MYRERHGMSVGQDEVSVRGFLIDRVAARCRLPVGEVDPDRPLDEFGLTSRDAVAIAGELEERLGVPLPATLVYEHPTIARLAAALTGDATATTPRERSGAVPDEPVAVVGLGCRFPGGIDGPASYWDFLIDRGDAIGEVPDGRWDAFDDGSLSDVTRFGGFLGDIAGFDSRFFGITGDEADLMDPQQRMLLEVAWEAFEHAGLGPKNLRGSRTGVFVGISAPEYGALSAADLAGLAPWTATGASLSIAANRISYLLDLRGPSMIVDTACSSSLVATHLAVKSLRGGESDVAVAGGVNVLLSPMVTKTFDLGGATAPDGRCKAFDASADGMVRAEGCGVLILKRLSDALRDGDRVLAVVRGSAVNSDGRSNGLVAPNPEAQTAVLREAYEGLPAPDYVEAHGTGTLLGDPIEARALGAAFPKDEMLIGSVKSNLGHLEPAAGVAGLIKVVLSLAHRRIPASLRYREPNPHIDFAALGLSVVAEETRWPETGRPALAGVSGFGFGGTNAHVVLEEAPATPPARRPVPVHTLLLSDVTTDRVGAYAHELADWLENSEADLTDVTATLNRRFGRGRAGAAYAGRDRAALVEALRAEPVVSGVSVPSRTAWVFSGYGAQRPGMGQRLLAEEPAFARAIDELDGLFAAEAGFSLWDVLESGEKVTGVFRTMTTLFGLQLGLAALWRSYGCEPDAVLGHSMGEIAAAMVAGALSTADGVKVIVRRSRLLASLVTGADNTDGAMLVVGCGADDAMAYASDCAEVYVAVRSSARQTVLTGDADELARVAARAEAEGLLARLVQAEGAGHSPAVDPILDALRTELSGLSVKPPAVPFYTSVLDDPRETPAFDGDYWARNTRQTVRFADAVRAAADDGIRTFVELNAHPLLAGAVADTADGALVVPTLRRARKGTSTDDTLTFHQALATLTVTGHRPAGSGGQVIDVPVPAWEHQHHWLTARPAATAGHPLLGPHAELPGEDRHVWSADVGDTPWPGTLHGFRVLPAAAYAELALAAGAEVFGEVTVIGLHVENLLALAPSTTVTTTLTGDGALEIHAQTPAGTWTRLATATLTQAEPEAVRSAEEGVPVEGAGRRNRYLRAHPEVLGHCLNLVADLLPAPPGTEWTPESFAGLRVHRPIDRGGRCLTRVVHRDEDGGAGFVAGLCVTGDDGEVLLAADEVRMRPIARTAVPTPLVGKLVETVWEPHPLGEPDDGDVDRLILAAPGDPIADSLPVVTDWEMAGRAGAELVVVLPPELIDERLVLTVTSLVRGLVGRHALPRLWLVTRDAGPGQAFLSALIRVLGFEHPGLRATWLDIGTGGADLITAELAAHGDDTEIAWRDRVRHAARLRTATLDGTTTRVVRRGAAYVISGGYGGLGLVTARLLAERGAGRIVLSGRSGPPPDAEKIISELRESGTEIEIVLGDIADPGVAERMTAAATEGGKRLAGVVHAAGGLADRLFTDIGADDLRQVWRPKVEGARRLHEATREIELDWWVAYSSAAALLGSPGQGSYAAANAAVDALVGWRVAHGLPGTTINWGTWSEVGGAAGLTVQALDPINPREGAEAFEALLAYGRAATGVLRFDPAQALDAFPEIREMPYFTGLMAAALEAGPEVSDDWPGPEALRAAAPDAARDMITKRVRDRVHAVLGFAPDPAQPLTDLGLDSLVAIRIKSALEHDFGLTLPATLLLQGASIDTLDEWTAGEFGLATEPAAPSSVIEPRDASERLAARLFEEVLGVRSIGVTDDFFALGGGTDQARMVLATLETELGRPLDMTELFARPTVEHVAGVIRADEEAAAGRLVRPLTRGPGTPVFLAHPAGGTTGVYQQLATLAGGAFVGLERLADAPGVPERAARYVELLRERQPRGPYRLGGWSFGGVLAYEIARQLGAENVEVVVLLDAGVPKRVTNPAESTARRYADFGAYLRKTYGLRVELDYEELRALDQEAQLTLVLERAVPLMELLPPAILEHQLTSHADTQSLEAYRPGPYDGRVVLYTSTEPTPWAVQDARYELDEARGFGDLCRDLDIVPVPGAHHLNLLDPPGVQVIAEHLGALLTVPAETRR